ncbi:MAG: polysaccharide deacetylase family protein [Actinobacteria bacterium]|nr:MAG: polysaccharide deacetylase family protein [Actinomycetota bacterium]
MRSLRLAAVGLIAAALTAAGCGSSHHGSTSSRQPAPAVHRPATGGASRFQPLAVPAHYAPHRVRIPILTYHRVHTFATELHKSQPDLTVEPDTFRAEMAAIARAGYQTITQRQLFDALYRAAALPPKPVIVSVDDGYVDDVTEILPVLRQYHMTATFYVITGRTHEQGFLNPDQIRQLEAAGMDIGAHTRTHASLPALPPAELRSEVDGSASDLRRLLGHPVYWFAYPYGAFNDAVVREVRRAGFLLAVTTRAGETASTDAPLEIPRIHVGRAATASTVLGLLGGGAAPRAPAGAG